MPSLLLPAFPRMLPTPAASSYSLQILLTPTTSSAAPSQLFLPRREVAHRAGCGGMRGVCTAPGMLERAVHNLGDAASHLEDAQPGSILMPGLLGPGCAGLALP